MKYLSSGEFHSQGSWIHPRRVLDSNEIIVMTEGHAYIDEGGTSYALHAGDALLFVVGNVDGGYRENQPLVPVGFYWVHFRGGQWKNKHCTLSQPYQIQLLFRQLLHYSNTIQYPEEASDACAALILMEFNAQQDMASDTRAASLGKVCEWIRINADSKITVRTVAQKFGYHEDYMTRLFKDQFGIGMKAYINEERTKRIKGLLLTTSYPIKQIASMSGFDDYKEFLKFFRYHEGLSPSSFRKLYFNTHLNKR